MSDKFCAFNLLLNSDNEYRQQISADFYQEFKDDTQVMDKYFSALASSSVCNVDGVSNDCRLPLVLHQFVGCWYLV
jgi:aminopeptidase N